MTIVVQIIAVYLAVGAVVAGYFERVENPKFEEKEAIAVGLLWPVVPILWTFALLMRIGNWFAAR